MNNGSLHLRSCCRPDRDRRHVCRQCRLDHIREVFPQGLTSPPGHTSYLVSNAIIIPMTGWLSRYFGRKRILFFHIALYAELAALRRCMESSESGLFSVLQGIGGVHCSPYHNRYFSKPSSQAAWHGKWRSSYRIMFGPIIGPLLGGWITDNWSCMDILINIPMVLYPSL